MRCPACSADNDPSRRFCSTCGGPLVLRCPTCGFANAPADRFCGGCGKPVGTSAMAAPAGEGDLRPVTVLFADLSGYTSHTGSNDPEEVRGMLNAFFAAADRIIDDYGGTVDKQ